MKCLQSTEAYLNLVVAKNLQLLNRLFKKSSRLALLLNSEEALGLDQSVVQVDNQNAQDGKSHTIDIEDHREIGLGDLDEHVGTLDCLPELFGLLTHATRNFFWAGLGILSV